MVARVWLVLVGISVLLLPLSMTTDVAIGRFDSAVAAAVMQYGAEWIDVVARGVTVLGGTPR